MNSIRLKVQQACPLRQLNPSYRAGNYISRRAQPHKQNTYKPFRIPHAHYSTTQQPPSLSLPSPPKPTIPRQKPIDTDTITFVDELVAEGFQREHAEALLQSMGDLLDSALHAATRDVVLRTEQDKVTYMYKVML